MQALALRAGAAALQADVYLPGGRCPVVCASEAAGRLARARERAPEHPLLLGLEVWAWAGCGKGMRTCSSPNPLLIP